MLIIFYIVVNCNYCVYVIDLANKKFYYKEIPIFSFTKVKFLSKKNDDIDKTNDENLHSLHRIYIRLQKRMDKRNAVSHYYLLFGGVDIEEVRISREDTSILKLREMGKDIANKLNLNYFDHEDKSAHHVIRHSKPQKASE